LLSVIVFTIHNGCSHCGRNTCCFCFDEAGALWLPRVQFNGDSSRWIPSTLHTIFQQLGTEGDPAGVFFCRMATMIPAIPKVGFGIRFDLEKLADELYQKAHGKPRTDTARPRPSRINKGRWCFPPVQERMALFCLLRERAPS